MIWLIPLAWYVQDLFQVVITGRFMAPEIFLVVLLFQTLALYQNDDSYLWIAFAGGLLWDLRWSGLPGLTPAIYVAVFVLLRHVWSSIPLQGRTPGVFCAMLCGSTFLVGLVRVLLWGWHGQVGFIVLVFQQISTLPFLLVAVMLYSWSLSTEDVR